MKQALSTIADKIARILNGDPYYVDNWHDIIGYAKLIEDRINMLPSNEEPQGLYDSPSSEDITYRADEESTLTGTKIMSILMDGKGLPTKEDILTGFARRNQH
jgi:hypothetical protein